MMQRRCSLIVNNCKRIRSNLPLISSNRCYDRGSGVRRAEDVQKEIVKRNEDKKEENPFEYTIFGNKRRKKEDVFHYTDRSAGRGYSDFANHIYPNRPYIWQPLRKLYWWNYALVLCGMILLMIDFEGFMKYARHIGAKFRPEAATIRAEESEENGLINNGELSDDDDKQKKKKKKKNGFRDRRIIEYENRIRTYSTPDKIFRYFATLKILNEDGSSKPFDVYMTPEDFVRSLTPGVMQPRNLGLDQFKVYDPENDKSEFAHPDSVFAKLDVRGLISFSDYIFLLTLLSTSPKDLELALKIFDKNANGKLDKKEFEHAQYENELDFMFYELIMAQTTVASRHRDHVSLGLCAKKQINSSLSKYFFGPDENEEASLDKFMLFQAHLHRDILRIECERRDEESMPLGYITEVSFADLLLVHSCLPEQKRRRLLKRVKKRYGAHSKERKGVTLDEVEAFFCFLYNMEDIDVALHYYHMAGVSIDHDVLKSLSTRIVGREISDHVIDIVITLFDDNQDGQLSNKEFVSIMKKRIKRGLERPRDTGFVRLLDALSSCAIKQIYDSFHSIQSHS